MTKKDDIKAAKQMLEMCISTIKCTEVEVVRNEGEDNPTSYIHTEFIGYVIDIESFKDIDQYQYISVSIGKDGICVRMTLSLSTHEIHFIALDIYEEIIFVGDCYPRIDSLKEGLDKLGPYPFVND